MPILPTTLPRVTVADGVEGALAGHVATRFSRHERPREVRFVDSLPHTAMGKIEKSLLT